MADNNFDRLEKNEEAPENIRSGVEGSLNFLRFVLDVVDVYVVQAGSAAAGFMEGFDTNSDQSQKPA